MFLRFFYDSAIPVLFKTYKNFKLTSCTRSKITYSVPEITAGVLIIGDEILSGQTQDLNSGFLIKNLNLLNIKVSKIAVVPDDIDAIVKEVSLQSSQYTVVLTSGGIGPTHDDVTYEAVAKAFSDTLQLNEEIYQFVNNYFTLNFGSKYVSDSGVIKFSSIPKSAVLNYEISKRTGKKTKFPIVSVRNVYILPGVPALLERGFDVFKSTFTFRNNPKFTKEIFLTVDEFFITPILNEAVKNFEAKVTFGSYPSYQHNYYKVKLVLKSHDQGWIEDACNFLNKSLPDKSIITINSKSNMLTNAKENVHSLSKNHPILSTTLLATERALENYKLSEICFCFNGGKDCTALLYLFFACVQKLKPQEWNQLKTLYIQNGESFKQVDNFINETVRNYKLNLITLNGDLKEATNKFLLMYPETKAMFLGTRRCDPGAENLSFFSLTDSNWPSVTRILPLLDWSYSDIWSFIRTCQIPYCVLYDQGYTSLGNKSSTVKNPALLINYKDYSMYKPAYMLENESNERMSRK